MTDGGIEPGKQKYNLHCDIYQDKRCTGQSNCLSQKHWMLIPQKRKYNRCGKRRIYAMLDM